MRIGTSIALIAIGLILALAVNFSLSGVDVHLVGWILTIVGVIGLVVSIAVARRSRVVRRDDGLPPTRSL